MEKITGKVREDSFRLFVPKDVGEFLGWHKKTPKFDGVLYSQRRASPQQCIVLAVTSGEGEIEPRYSEKNSRWLVDLPLDNEAMRKGLEKAEAHLFRVIAGQPRHPTVVLLAIREGEKD